MKKDPALQQLFRKDHCVKPSDDFTNQVMDKLPPRRVLPGWSLAFLSFLWLFFIGWVWFWRADLLYMLTHLNGLSLPLSDLTPYLAFLTGAGLLLWQTCDFFMKIFLSAKVLKIG